MPRPGSRRRPRFTHSGLIDFWERTRTSYWFVPTLMAVAAAILAVATVRLDRALAAAGLDGGPWGLVFGLGPIGGETARSLLTAIAGGMVTVTGVVFSVTIVALQLASSQFGPRLLRAFMADLGNQIVLGTFITTFVYSLLVLSALRGEPEPFVPHIALLLAVLLGLAATGVLIYFINHIANEIRAETVIDAIADELDGAIETLFPDTVGEEPPPDRRGGADVPADFDRALRPVMAGAAGYVRRVDEDTLMKLAGRHDLVLRLDRSPGDFVLDDTVAVSAYPAARVDDAVARALAEGFALGPQRTPVQDIDFALRQLSELAVRALSPGINDPFTALVCIDRLGEALSRLVRRRLPSGHRYDAAGRLRLIARRPSLPALALRALDPIMRAGGNNGEIVARLLQALGRVAARASGEDRRALLALAEAIHREGGGRLERSADRALADQMHAEAIAPLTAPRPGAEDG
ncbi:MAG TPA: DUF2254 domain-containing protein [Alphaproteobacteria bacterium]|nr:DUF2254 domain-containing protein [Alphaproteobacteria bacterium]